MKRIMCFGSVWLILAAVGWVGCSVENTPTNVVPQMTDAEALIGSWQSGTHVLTFGADGTFRWERPRRCGAPPCPATSMTGTFSLRHGQIFLDPTGEGAMDEILDFKISWNPRRIWIANKRVREEYNLNFR